MKKDMNNIHDKSYKTLFSNKDIFLNLLNDFTENEWNVPHSFKEKISKYELFGEKLLDFEYILLDVNRYEKEVLIEKQSISSAIFLLDQKVDYEEYMNRLVTIVKAFHKLTAEEKLELKNWLAHTLSEEIKDVALNILDADKEEVDKMTANITRTIEEIKEEAELKGRIDVAISLLDVLDDETIAVKVRLPLEKVKELRRKKHRAN